MDQTLAARQRFGRIMHATDLSPEGASAFAHALKLALAARGEFFVVHTATDRAQAGAEWEAFPGVRATLARWNLLPEDAPKTAVRETLGVNVRKIDIPDHNPVHGIQGLVDQYGLDLVVMASEARDGLSRWLHGSVAESVARKSGLPALFLPRNGHGFVDPADGQARLRNILVPFSRRPAPDAALAFAMDMTTLLGDAGTVIHLFHVGDDQPIMPDPREAGFRIEHRRGSGPVVEQIVATADAIDADLIIMATDGHDGVLDILRGSTTEQVLRHAGRALIAVPAG